MRLTELNPHRIQNIREFIVRMALAAVAAGLAVSLAGCGGGGGGGSDPATATTQSDSTAEVANTLNASAESVSLGDLLVGLAKIEVAGSRHGLSDTGASEYSVCGNADGSVQVDWVDASGDGQRGAGDTVTLQYVNCALPQTGSYLSGTVMVKIASRASGQLGLEVDYGGGLLLVDARDQAASHVYGSMKISWADDGLTRQMAITSSARDDLRLTANNPDDSTGRIYTEQVQRLDVKHTLSRETARANTTLDFDLISEYHGDTYIVSTPVELSSYFDTYPDRGEMAVRAKSTGTRSQLTALYSANGRVVKFDVYANGAVEPADSAYAEWNAITTGVMWWAESLGGRSDFSPSLIGDVVATNFKQLRAAPEIGAVAQTPTWGLQFSRPVDPASLPALRLRRQNLDVGDPYFWGSEKVAATVVVKGAYVMVTPVEPLQHGLTYALEAFDADGVWQAMQLKDLAGNTATAGANNFTVDNSLIAYIDFPSDAPILTGGKAIVASGAHAQSTNGLVSYLWTQVSGPSVAMAGADQANATVSLVTTPNADGVVVLQLKVTDARGQVEYARKAINVMAHPADGYVLYFRSEAGDYIGQGRQFVILPSACQGSFREGYPPAFIYFLGCGDPDWGLTLFNGQNTPIQVGEYDNAVRAPGSDSRNGLDFNAMGRGCNELQGRFNVLEVAYDGNGHVTKLAVDFDQYCDGLTAGLFGSFRYHSDIPVRP
jgi:hypothetical protein